jgi:hypothetical protein
MDPEYCIRDEYGRVWSKRLFIKRLKRWNKENDRSHTGQKHFVDEIDGFEWLRGDWC